MSSNSKALAISRPLIRAFIVLNLLYAAAIFLLLVASLIAADFLFEALGVQHGDHRTRLVVGMRAIMVVGILAAVVVDRVLRHLLAIVDTVRTGDPFVAGNARRLQAIAGYVLAGEVLRLLIGAIAWAASTKAQSLDVHAGFSLGPWLAVLLLFVLARVFEEGSRMRADLEGTV